MRRLPPGAALLVLAAAACGAPSPPPAAPAIVVPPAPAPTAVVAEPALPNVTYVGTQVVFVSASGPDTPVDPAELHPPPGDRALLGITPTAPPEVSPDGAVVGMGDGTVTSLDLTGHRRWSVGFRGAIVGVRQAAEGHLAVTTRRGVAALVTRQGRVLWEKQITAEPLGPALVTPTGLILVASRRGVFALSPAGEVVFSHASPLLFEACERRCEDAYPELSLKGDEVVAGSGLRFRLDGPHPEVPSLAPTFPLTFRKVASGSFSAVVATGPREVTALIGYAVDSYNSWPYKPRQALVRTDGSHTTRIALPGVTHRKIDFNKRVKPTTAPLLSDGLVTGPDGSPWILSRALSGELTGGEDGYSGPWVGECQIFEVAGAAARERTDLTSAFAPNLGGGTFLGRIAAAPRGRAGLFCFGSDPTCALYDGPRFRLIAAPGRVAFAGRIGDVDWVVTDAGAVLRRDGAEFHPVPLPDQVAVQRVDGTSERDVWAEVKDRHYTALHFDGTRWAEVAVPADASGGFSARAKDDVWTANGQAHWDGKRWSLVHDAPLAASVLARDRDDVWMAGDGLWHGTAPGPTPVRLAAPEPPDEGAVPPPPPLPLDAVEARYAVERTSLAVAGGAPITAGTGASAAPDGGFRLRAWDRVVDVDAGYRATEHRRGAAQKAPPPWRVLPWRVLQGDELSPHAVVLAGEGDARPVMGLPAASWSQVAQAADGGAWFAGGLDPGPSGEGILFHVRGRLGAGGTSRIRVPASLLEVAAIGADEAWAVGAGGAVVHVQGAVVARYSLPSGEWLRAVAAHASDDVWMGGDGGTLLHYDGRSFHPVSHPLGPRAAFVAIVWTARAVWAVSPSGLLRITKRP